MKTSSSKQSAPVTPGYVGDLSLSTPDQQFQGLTNLLEADDATNPAPRTGTPPGGEAIPLSEYTSDTVLESEYMPEPDLEASASVDILSTVSDAAPVAIPEWDWENDDQYFGLGVPPGVPNYGQPIESGHSQITVNDPSAELGWDAWSGRPVLARVARMENHFSGYRAGQSTGHNIVTAKATGDQMPYRTQQARDLLLAELMKRGIHNVVVSPVAAVPYTEQVPAVDPTLYADIPIGPEGVLP